MPACMGGQPPRKVVAMTRIAFMIVVTIVVTAVTIAVMGALVDPAPAFP
jgi:hypothetical protein